MNVLMVLPKNQTPGLANNVWIKYIVIRLMGNLIKLVFFVIIKNFIVRFEFVVIKMKNELPHNVTKN